MAWEPISETDLLADIERSEFALRPQELLFWNRIRISPIKWQLPPWGEMGGGFWVVAIFGQECLWYNDIEEGFNISPFSVFGLIGDYRCNQSELDHCVAWYFDEFMRSVNRAEQGVAPNCGGSA
jgi:hypothetical protein